MNGSERRHGGGASGADSATEATATPADTDLIARIQAGDPRAIATLFDRYFDALIRSAYYLLGSLDAAQDVVQEVFVRLWEHPETFAPSRSLKQYLYTAVRNRALDERKYESVRVRHRETARAEAESGSTSLDTPSPEGAILQEATVQAAMRRLSERRQEAVRLRIEGELTHAEIGRILGISAGAAERLVLRALEDLRKILRVSD